MFVIWIFALTIVSCSPAKYVPDNNYLLSKNKIKIENKAVNKSELENYYLQKPNKTWILGLRVNLFFYNLSNVNKNNWFQRWLRKIGEEPVVYDPYLAKQTKEQFRKYFENKGYYYTEIKDSVTYDKPNAKVIYTIVPNEPFRIRNIYYLFEDTSLVTYVMKDTINSLITKGMLFDKEILQQERGRIEDLLKENGFYNFSKEYVYFDAKAVSGTKWVDITMGIKQYIEGDVDPKTKVQHHPRFKISNVNVYPDFVVFKNSSDNPGNNAGDTIQYDRLNFITKGNLHIKPSVISNYNYLITGDIYNFKDVDRTYRNFTSLGLYKFVNIEFSEPENAVRDSAGFYPLNVNVELTRNDIQSYQIEPLLTNSSGDFGLKSNLLFQNLNLFRGAEIFNLKLTGAFEVLKDSFYTSTVEYGAESSLEIPRFWLPFKSQQFVKKYGPKTLLSFSINHRTDKRYVRTYANASFGYTWKGNRYLRHSVYPFELNFVSVNEDRSKDFLNSTIKGTPLEYSFTDHFVGVSRYTVEYNNQRIGLVKNFMYVRNNFEIAGNTLYVFSKNPNGENFKDSLKLFNSPFAQYIRDDIDFRFYNVINAKNKLVSRIFIGIGFPYGNSSTMPYEKKFFVGGPNSIRAWNAYTLGPGSYRDTTSTKYSKYKNIGDIKLELNLEYRFKMFWKLEGALFVDAGNIWDINKNSDIPEGIFKWNKFYKDLALGTGFGTRFDFSFFLLRVDFGLKIHNPSALPSQEWISFKRKLTLDDFAIQFGIGYPF